MGEGGIFSDSSSSIPYVISGGGVLIGLILLGETATVLLRPDLAPNGFLVGIASSLPFIIGLIYGGYWLEQSALSPERYVSIARWWIAGIIGTTLLIVGINASLQSVSPLFLIGTIRWSSAVGGSIGFTIGVLQVQKVQRAIETERTRFQLQETKRERDRLDDFASIVSHDLRNPLNVAQGRLELASKECDNDHLDEVARAHERMQLLIDDILALARAGKDVNAVEPVDLADLTENCWLNVDTAEATLTAESDQRIQADFSVLQQLLENLFRNAVEHGSENVTVTVGELANGFYVEDDGSGIPEEEQDDVFERGYSTAEDGTGLGLSIVKQAVEGHGWDIRVTNGSQGGARFEVTNVEFAVE